MYTPQKNRMKGLEEVPGKKANVDKVSLSREEEEMKGPRDGTVQGTKQYNKDLGLPDDKLLNNEEAQQKCDVKKNTVKHIKNQIEEAVKYAKPMSEMTAYVQGQVAMTLDVQIPGGNNWEVIAERLNVPKKLIRSWVSRNETVPTFSPTKCMFEYLSGSQEMPTVLKLRNACSEYGRYDVVRAIDENYDPNQ